MRLLQGTDDVTDTTLSSQQPTTNQDTIQSFGVGQKWLSTGDNSGTYGTTRAAPKFDTTAIPTTATVLRRQRQQGAGRGKEDERRQSRVAEQINSGNTVFYQVMVHYPSATDPMPDRFDTTWNSSSGASGSVPVYNTP